MKRCFSICDFCQTELRPFERDNGIVATTRRRGLGSITPAPVGLSTGHHKYDACDTCLAKVADFFVLLRTTR